MLDRERGTEKSRRPREIIDVLIFVIDFEDNRKIKIAKRNNRIFSLNNIMKSQQDTLEWKFR